jgi:pimeloyl-ACP methyl ester carboxylesterase
MASGANTHQLLTAIDTGPVIVMGLGHSPHIQAPEHFHAVLLEQLASESRKRR